MNQTYKKMKRIKVFLVAIIILSLTFNSLNAQTMYLKKNTGTISTYSLNSIKKLSFSERNLVISKTESTSESYDIYKLSHLSFKEFSTSISNSQPDNYNLTIYPNPASNVLYLDLSANKNPGTLKIISLEGKVVLSRNIMEPEIILVNIGSLPKGTYICQYNDGVKMPTSKIIIN